MDAQLPTARQVSTRVQVHGSYNDHHPNNLPGGSDGKESVCNAGDLGSEDPLEKGMASHYSILT